MEVKLTKTGLDLFGFGLDRKIINVHLDRAYTLMVNGCANKDKPFMVLYEANHPKPAKAKVMKKPEQKKEKAVSKKAAKREKAVKQ